MLPQLNAPCNDRISASIHAAAVLCRATRACNHEDARIDVLAKQGHPLMPSLTLHVDKTLADERLTPETIRGLGHDLEAAVLCHLKPASKAFQE